MNSIRRAIVVVIGAHVILFPPAIYGVGVAGSYQTVTESEWGIELSLNRDGSAHIEIASWLPGESDKANIEKHKGTWAAEGGKVTVRVGSKYIVFAYVARLSFASFGRKGSAPGLEGITSTFEPKLFAKRQLWLTKELRKLKWDVTD
jgi:hypothetical protein